MCAMIGICHFDINLYLKPLGTEPVRNSALVHRCNLRCQSSHSIMGNEDVVVHLQLFDLACL